MSIRKVAPADKLMREQLTKFASAVVTWQQLDDEASRVIVSWTSFHNRIPMIESAAKRGERCEILNELGSMRNELWPSLVNKHANEKERLAAHLRGVLMPRFTLAYKAMEGAWEAADQLMGEAGRDGWDPAVPAGACPVAPATMASWLGALWVMFSDELWRKEELLNALLSEQFVFLQSEGTFEDGWADGAALLEREDYGGPGEGTCGRIVAQWPLDSDASFVDAVFLEDTMANMRIV